jgi:hypothetical protein
MSKQLKLKQSGNTENFNVLKYESNSDMWSIVLEIERDAANHAYKIKNKAQTFIVYDKFEQVSKTEYILGRDVQENINRVVEKRIYSLWRRILMIPLSQVYFENNGNVYTENLISAGTKGTIKPVNKNDVPIAVFSQSNIKINGQFQLELSVADWATDEEVSDILLFYIAEYIATHNLSEVGLLSANVSISYQFNALKELTQEHRSMLPVAKRPTKFEAFSWYYASLPLLYTFFEIMVLKHYSLKPLLITLVCMGVIYLLILGIVILTKNKKGSK